MIAAPFAAVLVAGAGWHALVLLAGRADGVGLATTLALATALTAALARARHRLSAPRLAAMLVALGAAAASGVALLEIGALVVALLCCALARPRWPVLSLALLAVPILPTLDLLLAWPLRRLAALITLGLLRANGVNLGLDGVALEWHGRELLFDGPCSGVRMLWALLVLASLAGVVRALPPHRFALLLLGAVAVAILGNALRAASLFYLEAGFVPGLRGPIVHEAVGLAAFALAGWGALRLVPQAARPA